MSLKILLTNDDGFDAPGLLALEKELRKWGDCFIAAPLGEKSASGHAVTIKNKIRVERRYRNKRMIGFAIDGTPADCVKFAFKEFYERRLPDLVVSGINPEANTGASIYYSGTIAAAREAIFSRVPAIAVSLANFSNRDYRKYAMLAAALIKKLYKAINSKNYFYSINIPTNILKPRGVRLTHQSHSRFEEEFVLASKAKGEKTDYFLRGSIELLKETGFSDEEAVREGFVSVTPCQVDVSAYDEIKRLGKIFPSGGAQ